MSEEASAIERERQSAAAESIALAAPVAERERISAVDTLRGFALLGILVMNIGDYALHEGFDFHPTSIGNIGKFSLILWAVRFVLFEGKMRGIFSMLFGAGVILLTSRLEKRGEGASAADIFLQRNMWLVAIGALHGYFLWWGDILYSYGMTALLFLYPFRKVRASNLILTGIAVAAIFGTDSAVKYEQRKHRMERAMVARAAEAAGQKLTDEQKEDLKSWERSWNAGHPDRAELDKEIAEMRGGYVGIFHRNVATTDETESTWFYHLGFCDTLSMMLIGMGLLRMGFLSGELSYRVYAWTAAIGYGIGLPLGALSAWETVKWNFDSVSIFRWLALPYDLQRLLVGLAHASIVLMIVKSGALKWITRSLAAVGQTALSNYLGTTLICVLLFDGFGFGLFGKLQFYQLFYVVAAIWAVNLAASLIWLKYFRFGPVEWLWRSLTYWELQPMRRVVSSPT